MRTLSCWRCASASISPARSGSVGGEMGQRRFVHGGLQTGSAPAPRRAVPDLLRSPVVSSTSCASRGPTSYRMLRRGSGRRAGSGDPRSCDRPGARRGGHRAVDERSTASVPDALHRGRDRSTLGTQLGQGLFEDRLAVGVAAPLLHVGEVRLVRLVPRRRRRVLRVLAGGEPAPGTVPRSGNRDVGRETRPGSRAGSRSRSSPTRAGRGFAALGLSHRAGTDSAASNRVATTHGLLLVPLPPQRGAAASTPAGLGCSAVVPCLSSRPSAMIAANQISPMPIVSRSRLRSTTDDPPSDETMPPPNRSDRPPPLPLCRRTSSTISRLVMMSTMEVR